MHNTRQHTTGTAVEEQPKMHMLTAVEITNFLKSSMKNITDSALYDDDIKQEYMKVDEAMLAIISEDVNKRLSSLKVKDTESLYANVYSEIVLHVPYNFPSISSQAVTLLFMKFADFVVTDYKTKQNGVSEIASSDQPSLSENEKLGLQYLVGYCIQNYFKKLKKSRHHDSLPIEQMLSILQATRCEETEELENNQTYNCIEPRWIMGSTSRYEQDF